MEGNLLLEQFSRYKKLELEASPFHFLLDANIELNPHQINAFCAAIQALKTGGIVLADEVGLGKTIEAGLVLKYVLESGAKRVLIALPASLRKQWELELEDKFGLESVILDRLTVEKDGSDWRKRLTDNKSVRIVLTSYDYSSKLMKRFPEVKWDFIIIDEAHNLRNVFHGTKRAKNLYELSKGIPKILLTATPLQNSLTDLHGLVSFIDQRIFGSEKVFNKRYIEGQDYSDLKRELFEGVFGASDIALGALESGTSFEKMVLQIYQTCDTTAEFKKAFDKRDRKLNAKRDKKARELRSLLLTESSGAKEQALDATKSDIARYLHDVEYWSAFDEPEVDGGLHYWKVDNWGEKVLGSHGILFIGAFCDSSKLLFPVLLLCDEKGAYIDFDEADLVPELEQIDDMDVRYFTPTESEMKLYQRVYDNLTTEMVKRYQEQSESIKAYNRRKIENWERIQMEQLIATCQDMNAEIDVLKEEERASDNFYEKIDIRKKITEKSKALEKLQESFHEKGTGFKAEGEREIAAFEKQFEINPILLVNIVLKF